MLCFLWCLTSWTAPVVWYIPGWLRCGTADAKVIAELQLAFPGHHVVFKDWPGNGLWGTSVRQADAQALLLLPEIERMSPEQRQTLTIVGHSLGGRITVRLLANLAQRHLQVRQAILLGAALPYNDPDVRRMDGASKHPVLCICNPADITLRYGYGWLGGEDAPALGVRGTACCGPNVREIMLQPDLLDDVSFGSWLKDLHVVKYLCQHHALFYARQLRRLRE